MTKLEKVIKGLGLCRWRYEDYGGYWPAYDYDKPEGCSHAYVCWKCPYRAKENEDIDYSDCIEELHEDALELLKEQEAQHDYEAQSDMRDYCERYEPTYNPDDGSM